MWVWPASLHKWYGVPQKMVKLRYPHTTPIVLLYNACSRFHIIFHTVLNYPISFSMAGIPPEKVSHANVFHLPSC